MLAELYEKQKQHLSTTKANPTLFYRSYICFFYTVSILSLSNLGSVGGWSLFCLGQEAGYALDRPVCHRANTDKRASVHTHIHS